MQARQFLGCFALAICQEHYFQRKVHRMRRSACSYICARRQLNSQLDISLEEAGTTILLVRRFAEENNRSNTNLLSRRILMIPTGWMFAVPSRHLLRRGQVAHVHNVSRGALLPGGRLHCFNPMSCRNARRLDPFSSHTTSFN